MLVDGADLDEVVIDEGNCNGTVFSARRPVECSAFSAMELDTMTYVADHFADWTAMRVTEYSHLEPGWSETGDRETIPVEYAAKLRLE